MKSLSGFARVLRFFLHKGLMPPFRSAAVFLGNDATTGVHFVEEEDAGCYARKNFLSGSDVKIRFFRLRSPRPL